MGKRPDSSRLNDLQRVDPNTSEMKKKKFDDRIKFDPG